MTEPTFTVVVAAFDAESTIEAAIRSVLQQTRGDFELIVVDDGSTDATADRVRALADERIRLIQQENGGISAARNRAIEAGRGRYVSMLDSDDLWMPTYLDAMGAALAAHPEAGLAYTDAWVLDDATRRIQRVSAMAYQQPPGKPPSNPEAFLALLVEDNFVYNAATVPRAVLERVGGYSTGLAAGEDYELWLRIVAHGYRAVRPPGLLGVYRKKAETYSANEVRMYMGMREVLRLVAEEYDVPEEIRARARARIERLDTHLSAAAGEGGSAAAFLRARSVAVAIKGTLRPRLWYRVPPPEVASAFPDLRRL